MSSRESQPPTFFATTRWTLVRVAARGGDTAAVEEKMWALFAVLAE